MVRYATLWYIRGQVLVAKHYRAPAAIWRSLDGGGVFACEIQEGESHVGDVALVIPQQNSFGLGVGSRHVGHGN